MRLAIPDTVRRIPIDDPPQAIKEFAAILGEVRDLPASSADLEPVAAEAGGDALRDAMEDVGGPDVRETVALETGLGMAVMAQRVPGVEQARERRALTVQLPAVIPQPGAGGALVPGPAC